MSDKNDENDTEREKYGIVGGKATVDEARKILDLDDDEDSEDFDE